MEQNYITLSYYLIDKRSLKVFNKTRMFLDINKLFVHTLKRRKHQARNIRDFLLRRIFNLKAREKEDGIVMKCMHIYFITSQSNNTLKSRRLQPVTLLVFGILCYTCFTRRIQRGMNRRHAFGRFYRAFDELSHTLLVHVSSRQMIPRILV